MSQQTEDVRALGEFLFACLPHLRERVQRTADIPDDIRQVTEQALRCLTTVLPDNLSGIAGQRAELSAAVETLIRYVTQTNDSGLLCQPRFNNIQRVLSLSFATNKLCLAASWRSYFERLNLLGDAWAHTVTVVDEDLPVFAVTGSICYSEGVRRRVEEFGRAERLTGVWGVLVLGRDMKIFRRYAHLLSSEPDIQLPASLRREIVERGPGVAMLKSEPDPFE